MTSGNPPTICLIPGDGIGSEVVFAAAECLASLGLNLRFSEAQAGFDWFKTSGNAIPDETLANIETAGIALFGANSSPSTQVQGYKSPILFMRKTFDLYANLRPVFSLPGGFSRPGINLLIVRENTEGLYAGRERREGDTAIAERIITRNASLRIARIAFEQAKNHPYTQVFQKYLHLPTRQESLVTVVHKANVLKLTDGLFREACLQVASEFPELSMNELLVDAAAMRLIRDPENFDTIVTTNLFGDILSDEASALMGGLGVAPSANLGKKIAIFEPVHGSAPDIAGLGIANPLGAIFSSVMLLEFIGLSDAAARLTSAVYLTLLEEVMTQDLGGSATTSQVTHRIISNIKSHLIN